MWIIIQWQTDRPKDRQKAMHKRHRWARLQNGCPFAESSHFDTKTVGAELQTGKQLPQWVPFWLPLYLFITMITSSGSGNNDNFLFWSPFWRGENMKPNVQLVNASISIFNVASDCLPLATWHWREPICLFCYRASTSFFSGNLHRWTDRQKVTHKSPKKLVKSLETAE